MTAAIVRQQEPWHQRPLWVEKVDRERIQRHVMGFSDGWYMALEQLACLGLSFRARQEINAPPYALLRNAALDATEWAEVGEPGYVLACEIALHYSREHYAAEAKRGDWRRP